MAYSDAIISISNTVTDYITSNYDVRDKEIIRIYRGCNTSKFNSTHIGESWLKQWNIDNPEMINKKILLMPARITHWKGIEFFLELIKHLNNNDIFGLVIGKVAANKNRYLQTLKNSAKRLGLNDQNIKFLDALSLIHI